MHEQITEMEIKDTPDGGMIISCTLSKKLVEIILTKWMHEAIEKEIEKVFEEYNENFERVPEETSAVSTEDGSS